MIFDENICGLDLFKSPSGPLYNDPFGIVQDTGSTIPPMSNTTSLSTYVLELIGSQIMPIEIVTSPNNSLERNVVLPTPYLPQWDIKMIEVVGTDVGDILTGR